MKSTTEREIDQRQIVAGLVAAGHPDVAARLMRCSTERARRRRDRWPWLCGSGGCAWCAPRIAARWWRGMERWSAFSGEPVLLVAIPVSGMHPPEAVRGLRRGLRDVRDRAARVDHRWRKVAMAGMVDGCEHALVLVRHPELAADAVMRRIAQRWPASVSHAPGTLQPDFDMPADAAIALAARRRGTEPLRLLVLPQRLGVLAGMPADPMREAMPISFAFGLCA